MRYVEVAVRSAMGEKSTFTYASERELPTGAIVTAPLKGRELLGVALRQVPRPKFKTLPLSSVSDLILPEPLVKLAVWISQYYGAELGATLQLMLPPKLIIQKRQPKAPAPLPARHDIRGLPFTTDQSRILAEISNSTSSSFLIHGETGSGKTRVYGELARHSLSQGKSALILVPEIGMTTQIASDLKEQLQTTPLLLHSELTTSQRRHIWEELARADRPRIVVGTRSALFLPIQKLGLIVIDEAQDSSYKHEGAPKFHATRVASQLARLHGAKFVLGSATPSLVDYYIAEQKNVPILRMVNSAANSGGKLEIRVIDRRDQTLFGRSRLLSKVALAELENNLQAGYQSFVFLNRRGSSKLCMCKQCGWVAECSYCQLPLTYHQSLQKLLCHSCGRQYPIHVQCPVCGETELRYQTPGVQALCTEIQHLFPNARLLRIDSDTGKDDGLTAHYQDLYEGNIDILVGTQSIAKGLDLPFLTLGVIVDADSGLHMPDYLSGERMFQLIYQIMGRLGRHQDGKCIIQTLDPESPAVKAAINRSYATFYEHELSARKSLTYPPFTHLARIVIEHSSDQQATKIANKLHSELSSQKLRVDGPSPCFYPKLRGKYRWQLIVRSSNRQQIMKLADRLPKTASFDPDPTNLL